MSLPELAGFCDAFTIGGTKNGALFGEAIVLMNTAFQPHFRWHIKQRGALLAKGRLLGLQFRELLRDDYYFELAHHANQMALDLRSGILDLGYTFPVDSHSNQIFPSFPNAVIRRLSENYEFESSHPVDGEHTVIRLVTSWATPQTAVDDFLRDLRACGDVPRS
jgi:threonine aldolase